MKGYQANRRISKGLMPSPAPRASVQGFEMRYLSSPCHEFTRGPCSGRIPRLRPLSGLMSTGARQKAFAQFPERQVQATKTTMYYGIRRKYTSFEMPGVPGQAPPEWCAIDARAILCQGLQQWPMAMVEVLSTIIQCRQPLPCSLILLKLVLYLDTSTKFSWAYWSL